jgi:SNF2 family DNA or RNA helicase
VSILERNDWFELTAVIQFGPYQIPFHKLRRHIVAGKDEFTLPNGEIAIIPPEWFTQYMELFSHAQGSDEDDEFKLGKHYLTLVNELKEGNLAQVTISQRLEKLREFTELEPYDLPEKFNATLRPYQKAGYDWLMFLNSYRLGGCLADDMGLGKTVQTLALLAKQKELVPGSVSLLVMPTSLVYNWQQEARRFTPHLRVLNHTGTQRDKTKIPLLGYDLVITSYGTLRSDIELFKACYFHYVILDESQAIKNPSSIVSKATTQLRSTHRLILTGTPLENSTLDLWSQMNFVNPGLLGTQSFFKKHYLQPIEKKNDQHQKRRLHALIKPFLLMLERG